MRIFNFSSGPAMLPLPVLEKAQQELLSFNGTGMSVMELSHRSSHFDEILHGAEQGIRRVLKVPDNYRVLFLQGGAALQFAMVPMNLLGSSQTADYVVTGTWGKKAVEEARRIGNVNIAFSSEEIKFKTIPEPHEIEFSQNSAYVHYTSNETIDGVEFSYDLDAHGIPVVCDASSNILSKKIDVEKYAFIYAGAQKNIGPSGVTVIIIRDDLIDKIPTGMHPMLDYRALAAANSMVNTPNTWGIYLISLVCEWIENSGGVAALETINKRKAKALYDAIDSSDGYYSGHADRSARSNMNVTFRLPSEDLEKKFCSEATSVGLDGLAGHRSVGGIRASIYNAFPEEGVAKLIEFMTEFAQKND